MSTLMSVISTEKSYLRLPHPLIGIPLTLHPSYYNIACILTKESNMNIKDRVKVLDAPVMIDHTIGMKGVVTANDYCGAVTVMLDSGEERVYWGSNLEVVVNQCDGCQAGLPLDEYGTHKDGQMFGIGCTKHRY
jgi:hypothetical protein